MPAAPRTPAAKASNHTQRQHSSCWRLLVIGGLLVAGPCTAQVAQSPPQSGGASSTSSRFPATPPTADIAPDSVLAPVAADAAIAAGPTPAGAPALAPDDAPIGKDEPGSLEDVADVNTVQELMMALTEPAKRHVIINSHLDFTQTPPELMQSPLSPDLGSQVVRGNCSTPAPPFVTGTLRPGQCGINLGLPFFSPRIYTRGFILSDLYFVAAPSPTGQTGSLLRSNGHHLWLRRITVESAPNSFLSGHPAILVNGTKSALARVYASECVFRSLNGTNGAAVSLDAGINVEPSTFTSTASFDRCRFEDSTETMPARGVVHVSNGTAARFEACEFEGNVAPAGAPVSAAANPPPVFADSPLVVAVPVAGGGGAADLVESRDVEEAPPTAEFVDETFRGFSVALVEHDCLTGKLERPNAPQSAQPCPKLPPPAPPLEPAEAPGPVAITADPQENEAAAAPPPGAAATLGAPLAPRDSGDDGVLSRSSMWTVIAAAIVATGVIAVLLLLIVKHRRKARGRDWESRHPMSPLSAAMAQFDQRAPGTADASTDPLEPAYMHGGEALKPGDAADVPRPMPVATPLVFLPLDPIREGTCEFGDSNAFSGLTGMTGVTGVTTASARADSEPLGRN